MDLLHICFLVFLSFGDFESSVLFCACWRFVATCQCFSDVGAFFVLCIRSTCDVVFFSFFFVGGVVVGGSSCCHGWI